MKSMCAFFSLHSVILNINAYENNEIYIRYVNAYRYNEYW